VILQPRRRGAIAGHEAAYAGSDDQQRTVSMVAARPAALAATIRSG
jgi:hypothetical protein